MNNTICDVSGTNSSTICEYVRANCDVNYYFIAASFFCFHSSSPLTLALYSVAVLVVIIILISLLSVIVSNYLLYSVTNFTDLLGVSHNCLSYVVIPALNCIPDILNYHYSMDSNSIDLIMGQVIGANLITFSVIVGTIACLTPFAVTNKMELLREYSYISALVIIMTYVVSDSRITISECICLIAMYFVYVLTSLLYSTIDSCKMDINSPGNKVFQAAETSSLMTSSNNQDTSSNERTINSTSLMSYIPELLDLILIFVIPVSKKTLQKMKHSPDSFRSQIIKSHAFHVWISFFCVLLINLTVFMTNFWIMILFVAVISSLKYIPGFLNQEICSIIVDVASITNAMIIVTKLTKFLIKLLKNLGNIWEVSQYVMGLVVFSLLNSMNDIIMNVSLAVNFNPNHGIKSCLGSCCLLISIGLGFNGFWLMLSRGLQSGNIWNQFLPITLDWELYVSLASLNFIILFTLGYISFNNWVIDRKLGCFLISLWVLTIITCVLYSWNFLYFSLDTANL